MDHHRDDCPEDPCEDHALAERVDEVLAATAPEELKWKPPEERPLKGMKPHVKCRMCGGSGRRVIPRGRNGPMGECPDCNGCGLVPAPESRKE